MVNENIQKTYNKEMTKMGAIPRQALQRATGVALVAVNTLVFVALGVGLCRAVGSSLRGVQDAVHLQSSGQLLQLPLRARPARRVGWPSLAPPSAT